MNAPPHFAEVVVGINSYLINRSLRHIRFRTRYNASVVAIYREGARLKGSIRDVVLKAGDTLMLLSNVPWPADRHRRAGLYPTLTTSVLGFSPSHSGTLRVNLPLFPLPMVFNHWLVRLA